MKILLIGIVIFAQISLAYCQQNIRNDSTSKEEKTIKKTPVDSLSVAKEEKISFLFLGDIMSHDLQIQSAYNSKTNEYDFSTEFEHIRPIINNVDVAVGNLEVTLSGPPYKGYPMFSSPDQLAVDIKNAGINYLVTANNHIYDRGLAGFLRTMDVLDSLGFIHTGTFRNVEDKVKRHPMVIEQNNMRVALFNYTYGLNGDYYDPKMIVNDINEEQIKTDLAEAKQQKFDAIIVFFHWGDEYKRNSNLKQQEMAKFCFENGANAVIGSHPHVIQEMERFTFKSSDGKEKDVVVAYSLGNYVANYGSRRYTNGGAMFRFSLIKNGTGEIKIEDPGYYLIWVYRKEKTDKLKTYYVLPVSQFENDKILTGEHLKMFNIFKTDSRAHLSKFNKNVNEYIYDNLKDRWFLKK